MLRMGDGYRAYTQKSRKYLTVSSHDILYRLADRLEARKYADPQDSYVASLYDKGLDAILKKLGEETTELVMAAKDGMQTRVVHETTDLWFHCMVLLAHQGLGPQAVIAELDRRFGISGFQEKASRKR